MRHILHDWWRSVPKLWFWVGGGLYLLSMILVSYWLLVPLKGDYEELVGNQAGLENTYINLIQLDIETAIDSVDQHISRLSSMQQEFEHRLLKESNLNALMPVLDNYCTRSGLVVQTLEPLNRRQAVGHQYQKLYARVTLTGTFPHFLKWLKQLEANPEWILIEKLTIEPTNEPDQQYFDVELGVLRDRTTA